MKIIKKIIRHFEKVFEDTIAIREENELQQLEELLKIKRGTVIHCDTQESAKKLFVLFNGLNLTKKDGSLYDPLITNWLYYKENTFYQPFSGTMLDLPIVVYNKYNIIEVTDFMTLHNDKSGRVCYFDYKKK